MLADSGGVAGRALDLGSGGGLPGLVLASDAMAGLMPDRVGIMSWTLLDSRARSTGFLEAAVVDLGLTPLVTVRQGRAETLARSELRGAFDLVCARGFGAPAVTAECAAGFLRRGGLLVVSDPPDAEAAGERWPSEGLAELGLEKVTAPTGAFRFRLLLMREDCPDRFPRRTGVPQKRPLF